MMRWLVSVVVAGQAAGLLGGFLGAHGLRWVMWVLPAVLLAALAVVRRDELAARIRAVPGEGGAARRALRRRR